jgi:hypothetical protein
MTIFREPAFEAAQHSSVIRICIARTIAEVDSTDWENVG